MSLSREVADAYISIHGDLSKFRKDLERGRAVVDDQGKLLADDFAESMKKQDTKNMKDRWGALTKALYSGDKLDWNRVLGQFKASDLGKQRKQITAFLEDMQSAGYMTEEQFKDANKAMKRALVTIGDHRKAQEGITKEVADAKLMQDRYNLSLKGMTESADLDAFEGKWRKLGQTLAGVNIDGVIGDVDWSKLQKGTSSLEDFEDQINSTIIRARLLGRITDEQSDSVLTALDKYVTAEKERAAAIDESSASVAKMRTEADKARISLAGMIKAARTSELEADFKKIATAMATTNWGPVAKDHKSMEEMSKRVIEVTTRMQNLGRVSDTEFSRVRETLGDMTNHQAKYGVELDRTTKKFKPLSVLTSKMEKSWSRMDSTVRLVLGSIAAGASDLATLGSGLAGGATAIVSSLGMAAGAVVPIVAAFGAMGVGVALAVSGMDDLKARFPGVQAAAERIGVTWQAQAKNFGLAWGQSLETLLSNFNGMLAKYDFGTPMGKAFSQITYAFNEFMNGPGGFDSFLQAMTTSLPKAVEGFGTGFAGVFGALFSMLAAAAPVAEKLGQDFQKWGLNLGIATEEARKSGKLTEMFERMRESLKVVLDLVGSVGRMFGTVFSLGADTGNSLLRSLTQIVDKFTAWMKTEAGREAMLQWFSNAERIIRSMEPLMVGLGKAMALLVTPQSIAMFEDLMGTLGELLPIVAEVLAVISQLGIFNIIAEALLAIGKVLQPLLPPLGELATLIGDTLVAEIEALTPILVELAELFAPILGAVVDLAAVIVPKLVPALQIFGSILTVALDILGQGVKAVVDFLSSAERMGQFFTDLGNSITGMNDAVNQGLEDFWAGIGAQLATWGAEFAAGWNAFWTGLGTGISTVFTGIGTSISEWWIGLTTSFAEWFLSLGTSWNTFWSGLSTAVGVAWGLFTTFLGERFTAALQFFQDFFVTPWNQFWTAFWEALSPQMQASLTAIWATLVAWFTTQTTNFSNFITTVTLAWNTFWQGMFAYVSAKWAEIGATVSKWLGDVNRNITNFNRDVNAAWNKFWGDVGKRVSDAWNKMSADVAMWTNAVRAKITAFVSDVTSRWNSFWATVGTRVSSAWSTITGAVNTGISTVRAVISGFVASAQAQWNGFWSTVGALARTGLSILSSTVSQKLNETVNFFRQLPGQAGAALGGMASQLFSVGTSMIQGLINGVQAMAGQVAAAARGVVDGAIQAAKNLLNINSPSRVFRDFGYSTGEGFIQGMDRMQGVVANAAETMTGMAIGAFDKSRMYVAGLDAATGLANGLSANKAKVASALGALGSSFSTQSGAIGTMTPKFATPAAGAAAPSVGKQINIAEGAISVQSNARNNETVAGIVIDDIVTTSKIG